MDLVKRSIIVAVIAISLLTLLAACGGGVSEEDASGQGAADTNLTERPSLLAFRSNRDRNHEIYAMNADGSEVTILTNHPESDFFPS